MSEAMFINMHVLRLISSLSKMRPGCTSASLQSQILRCQSTLGNQTSDVL